LVADDTLPIVDGALPIAKRGDAERLQSAVVLVEIVRHVLVDQLCPLHESVSGWCAYVHHTVDLRDP